ncbi:hypothetical protein [Azomonas macrocytogenes]|uniref:Lipoprotein n=1 Tax=Azomonas macrocytogenes TaxID=69962 RepID=A0A839T613_AZOMA|nr:hypothetical protein [Azomonas macrocytogenes]MBB3104270.1 hypothetical protein [Azomonas macrocytogenes]
MKIKFTITLGIISLQACQIMSFNENGITNTPDNCKSKAEMMQSAAIMRDEGIPESSVAQLTVGSIRSGQMIEKMFHEYKSLTPDKIREKFYNSCLSESYWLY